ncbi:hypothetical protein AHAS_Ahas03G0180900 [Arachis hypogaea]
MTLEDVTHILGLLNCIACFGQEFDLYDHVLGKVNLDEFGGAETPNCVTHKIPLSVSVSTSRFPPDSTIHLGAACLAHLYRSLCCASRYNCKEMDRSLILLFIWAWKRMPFPTVLFFTIVVVVVVAIILNLFRCSVVVVQFIWWLYMGVEFSEYLTTPAYGQQQFSVYEQQQQWPAYGQ